MATAASVGVAPDQEFANIPGWGSAERDSWDEIQAAKCDEFENWIADGRRKFKIMDAQGEFWRAYAAKEPHADVPEIIANFRAVFGAWLATATGAIATLEQFEKTVREVVGAADLRDCFELAQARLKEPWKVSRDWVGPVTEETQKIESMDWGDGTDEFLNAAKAVFHQNGPLLKLLS